MTVFLKNLDLAKLQRKGKKKNYKGKKLVRKATSFPVKLHRVLEAVEKNGKQAIAAWNPDGRSFQVFDVERFVLEVLPQYFRQSKFKSFQRQLNFYKFHRISAGPFEGSYGHPCFLRGNEELCRTIKRDQTQQSSFLMGDMNESDSHGEPLQQDNEEEDSEEHTNMKNLEELHGLLAECARNGVFDEATFDGNHSGKSGNNAEDPYNLPSEISKNDHVGEATPGSDTNGELGANSEDPYGLLAEIRRKSLFQKTAMSHPGLDEGDRVSFNGKKFFFLNSDFVDM
mmetsp:Transcript_23997/g.44603  ORF Transcript_23997/g.44603 Transcript_23997/m.44603 type:complete len:284 (+) Transcript_23997:41-892(+)